MDFTHEPLPKHPFWDFSCGYYAQQSVKQACLKLQDQYQANINILLLCLWHAKSGHGILTDDKLSLAIAAISKWHSKIVLSLRKLRQNVTKHPDFPSLKVIYKEVLEQEIYAEHVEQLLLAKTIKYTPDAIEVIVDGHREAAEYSLNNYFKLLNTALDAQGQYYIAQLLKHFD